MTSTLGNEIYALREMVDPILVLRDFFGPSEDANPGVLWLGDCESLFADLKTKRMIAVFCAVFENPAGIGGRWPGECALAARVGESRLWIGQGAERHGPPFSTSRIWLISPGAASPPQRSGSEGVIGPRRAPGVTFHVRAQGGGAKVIFVGNQ